MSILRKHIKQELDLKQINLVQTKLQNDTLEYFDKVAKQTDHLTFPQKLDLVDKGYIVVVDSYFIKIKKFILDNELVKQLEEELYDNFKKNLPEIAKKSCKDCSNIPKEKRSCEYFRIQFEQFLIISSAIIFDEIMISEKLIEIPKELKQQIAIEFMKSITISKKGYGLDIGKLIEFLVDNELYQKSKELQKQTLSERFRICNERLKKVQDIGNYAKWKISDELIFNKWESFWNKEDQQIKTEIEMKSKLKELGQIKIENPLLDDLIEIAQRILNRGKKLNIHEDYINDDFTDFLETKGYQISDQKRLGNGRIDISVKNDSQNTIASIEATKFHSNQTIKDHLYKLLHKYNKTGHETNYLIVYSFDKMFGNKWNAYKNCVNRTNDKKWTHPKQENLMDITKEKKTPHNIKIGLSEHLWHGSNEDIVEIYHIFMNTYKN